MDDSTLPEAAARIAEQHRRLRELLGALESQPDLDAVAARLGELTTLLSVHFRTEEEAGGLEDVVREKSPHLLGRVDLLLQEHRELEAEADALFRQCRSVLEGPVAEIRDGVRRLRDRLRAHDEAENALLQEAMIEDLGTSE